MGINSLNLELFSLSRRNEMPTVALYNKKISEKLLTIRKILEIYGIIAKTVHLAVY